MSATNRDGGMAYRDLLVLIPSHSLEDFPTDSGDKDAASLLNAFAVPWHPLLLAGSGVIPSWHRADEPPDVLDGRLVIVPTVCDDWLPHGWIEHARAAGATVVAGYSVREDMLAAALEPVQSEGEVDPELAADFLALGTCYLQLELLTRHMRHYTSLDEHHLQQRALSAAKAALANDPETAQTHLRGCFEILLEARERFYPVDCSLLDLCLLIPDLADQHLEAAVNAGTPLNLLVTGKDLSEIAATKPQIIETLRAAWNAGTLNLVGGEYRETPLPLMPLESVLWQFEAGRRQFQSLFGRAPQTWGRRRFGLATLLPELLKQFGYHSALHLLLDDGLYPDAEYSKVRWEGCDGTMIDALSRIPLAADSATSFQRFPLRMSESMDQDQVAAVIFARWPEVTSPWLADFRRIHRYAPVLGRFVTFDEFFTQQETPGRLATYRQAEYFSPYLLQAVARREANPISRYGDHARRRAAFDAANWYRAAAAALQDQPIASTEAADVERLVEAAGPDGTPTDAEAAELALSSFSAESAQQLASVVMHGAESQPGFLLLNSQSFTRKVTVNLPELKTPPPVSGAIKSVQFDLAADDAHPRRAVTVEIPGSGFLWIPAESAETPNSIAKIPTAEENVLRNDLFEVTLNAQTGGIAQIRLHGTRGNRLSQQLGFRFPRERTIRVGPEEEDVIKTQYAEMRRLGADILCDGPACGEIRTTGELIDQQTNERLATFRQTVRVWRGRPVMELEIELSDVKLPEGDPWNNYFASRFAWNDSTAAITRSVLHGAHGFTGERFESTDYVEIATETERTTIVPHGLPFHRHVGTRMLDTLLIVAGETQRRFRFTIAIDEPYPLQAARDATAPVAVIPTSHGPPRPGNAGWFFHLDARNVQILSIVDLIEANDQAHGSQSVGFAVRLLETEGRGRRVRLRCFRTPTTARTRDFHGGTVAELAVESDAVLIDLRAYELAEVELRF